MPGRPNYPHKYRRLASGSQLWRLNQLGRLQVVDEASPLGSAEAKALIKAELAKLDETYLPDTKLARLLAETSAGAQSEESAPGEAVPGQ
jgi:hypothetical protein